MDDNRIIDLFLSRDEDAIRQTDDKYGARLFKLSLGIVEDKMVAEECENDTYSEAWRLIPPAEPRTYFYAFLARIARHISIDRCRERSALKRSAYLTELSDELAEILPSSESIEAELDAKLLGETISRYLLTLTKEKRMIFVGHYFYLQTISAVATRLGISESKVKTSLLRIRKALRSYLEKEGFDIWQKPS